MFLNNLFFRALFGYEKQTNDLTLVGSYLKQSNLQSIDTIESII
jgi:hypothetical protein